MRHAANVFVIVEDDFLTRFALRQCHMKEYEHYTTFDCHNEPTYILSRKCTKDYYIWSSACCKIDEMINYLTLDRPDLFATIKYVLEGDDDTYFRVDQILKWLAAVDHSGLDDFPLTGNSAPTRLNHGIWHIEGCKEVQASGWYQPILFNHAALQRLSHASSQYAISETCHHFDLSQDVGLEVYVWLHQLYHITIPRTEINGAHKGIEIFQPDHMIVHCVKADDIENCHGKEEEWPSTVRYNQKVVIGCGDVDTAAPFHNKSRFANMYDAYHYFDHHGVALTFTKGQHEFHTAKVLLQEIHQEEDGQHAHAVNSQGVVKIKHILSEDVKLDEGTRFQGEKVYTRIIPKVMPIEGYALTEHGKKYNLTKEWKAFTLQDCQPPGKIAH